MKLCKTCNKKLEFICGVDVITCFCNDCDKDKSWIKDIRKAVKSIEDERDSLDKRQSITVPSNKIPVGKGIK